MLRQVILILFLNAIYTAEGMMNLRSMRLSAKGRQNIFGLTLNIPRIKAITRFPFFIRSTRNEERLESLNFRDVQ